MIGLFLGDTDFSDAVLQMIKKLNKKYFIIDLSKNNKFKKDINSHRISIGKFGKIINLINLNEDFKNNELVLEVVNFLEKDKKRPICTPYSK